jgi:hypothetical protein
MELGWLISTLPSRTDTEHRSQKFIGVCYIIYSESEGKSWTSGFFELHSPLQIHRHILLISSPTCEGIPGRLLIDQFDIKAAKQLHYIQVDLNQSNVLANA